MTTAADLMEATRTVVGQEKARRRLTSILLRQQAVMQGNFPRAYGALIVGPSGTGKSLMARLMCEASGLPFAEANATQYTESGYAGLDLSQMFWPLLKVAISEGLEGWKRERMMAGEKAHVELGEGLIKVAQSLDLIDEAVARVEHGVILLDEFDKWVLTSGDDGQGRNPGRKLQAELLKIMEGSLVFVREEDGSLGVPVDTERISILCCGAFVGLNRLIAKRLGKQADDLTIQDAYQQMQPKDLVAFGLLPELVGRLTSWVPLKDLTVPELIEIMTEENGDLNEYVERFKLFNVELRYDSDALTAIATMALNRLTGARAIRNLFEELMSETLYEAAADPGGVAMLTPGNVYNRKVPYVAP